MNNIFFLFALRTSSFFNSLNPGLLKPVLLELPVKTLNISFISSEYLILPLISQEPSSLVIIAFLYFSISSFIANKRTIDFNVSLLAIN